MKQLNSIVRIFFFVMFLLVFPLSSFSVKVNAESDIIGPKVDLTTLSVSKYEVYPGDTVTVKVKATDDKSGIKDIYFLYESSYGLLLSRTVSTVGSDGYYSWSIPITSSTQDGVWSLYAITATDNAGNRSSIYSSSQDLSKSEFNVLNINTPRNNITDKWILTNTTWGDRTISSDLYIGPNAILTINGTVTVKGNIYVLGALVSYGNLSTSSIYGRNFIYGYTNTFYNGTVNFRGGTNMITSLIASNQPIPYIPINVIGNIVIDWDMNLLYIQGETIPIADLSIDGVPVAYFANGTFIVKDIKLNNSSEITINMTDVFGKIHSKILRLDNIENLVRITGVGKNGNYNSDRTIIFNKGIGKLDGTVVTSGFMVSKEGSYLFTLELTDGKLFEIPFVIDKTKPLITGVINGTSYNTSKTITFNDGTGKLDGVAFTSGSTVSIFGSHTLAVTDAAGNSTTIQFSIIPSNPVITVFSLGYNSLKATWAAISSATGYEVSYSTSQTGTYIVLPLTT